MTTKVRALNADNAGLALWLERESQTMHPLQFFREAAQNEIEAGALKIIIDGFKSGGRLLARVSGDGKGMTPDVLVSHLATVMKTDKGKENYGVGARIAALPANPAGTTFVSRTRESEGMIKVIKNKSIYGLEVWPVETENKDGTCTLTEEEVISPLADELAHVKGTGTAVILHGDGKKDTWDASLAQAVHNYLARRFYCFPGNVSVNVIHPWENKNINLLVKPFGQTLADWAEADGEVSFKDVAGLSGIMFWWVLPDPKTLRSKMSGQNSIASGAGLLVANEIFDHGASLTDFGIPYKSAQNRIVILIAVENAQMDTTRTSVVYPLGKNLNKRNTPWKALGTYFSEHMPTAIDNLISTVTPSGLSLTDLLASKLDPDWMRWLQPIKVTVPSTGGKPFVGSKNGVALPKGIVHPEEDGRPHPHKPPGPGSFPPPKPRKPKLAAFQHAAGNQSGTEQKLIVTPKVVFVLDEQIPEEFPLKIFWDHNNNTVTISEEFAPFKREIGQWVKKTGYTEQVVRAAVVQAYSLEYAGYIIDANGQRTAGPLPSDAIETLKSSACLYAKALGCQSLTASIEETLKKLVRVS